MDNMTVKLHILVEFNLHIMTVSTQVVARQVDQHHMFSILFRIVAQKFGIPTVLFKIAGALGGSRYRVDKSPIALHPIMSFGTGTKDSEASKVEIEQLRTRIDRT